MPLDCIRHFFVGCADAQVQHAVERVQAEEIAMCSGRWSWPHIPNLAAIVLALHSHSTHHFGIGYILRNVIGFWWNVIHNPMRKSAGLARI